MCTHVTRGNMCHETLTLEIIICIALEQKKKKKKTF